MVQKLVQNRKSYLLLRGRTYYFRFAIPTEARRLCPSLPTQVKRSLRTDSYSEALALVSERLPIIRLLQRCADPKLIKQLVRRLMDFSGVIKDWVRGKAGELLAVSQGVEQQTVSRPVPPGKPETPLLSEAWSSFVKWKEWNPKRTADNQRLFDNLLFFIGDKPVGRITKKTLRRALGGIAKLPQRNKKPYKGLPLEELVKFRVPDRNRVAGKYVKEHLKLCQSLFSRYLVQEVDILKESPTKDLRLDIEDQRFASMTDTEVRTALTRSKGKPEWFQWFLKLAVCSGARRSEIAGLRVGDFKKCLDTGRYYFVIQEGKTTAARRSIPLHRSLVDAGLLEWLGDDRKALLFPTAKQNPNRVTDLFGSLLDRKTNDVGERVVFHSIRHAFITKARSAGITTALVQQVVGHEKTGAGVTDRYTHSFQLKELMPVVDAVSY